MAEIKPFTGIDDRVRLAEAVPLATPFTLNLFPSNVCNFRCTYCAQSLGADYLLREYRFPQEMMRLDTLKAVIEQSREFDQRFKLVSFMGHGEPLCNRALPEMIRGVKESGIAERVDVITNASLLDHAYADALVEAGLDVLRVSLQGISAEQYFKTSGVRLDFERLVEQLAYFFRNRKQCRVYVKTVDAALNEGEEAQFFDLFSSISDRVYIDRVRPVYSGVVYSEQEQDLLQDRYGNSHVKRMVCPQPFYMLSVWANGDVTPCDALYKACPLGNVAVHRLREMWESEQKKAFCRLQLEKQRESCPACRQCCAPDDVASEMDVLDDAAEHLLSLF